MSCLMSPNLLIPLFSHRPLLKIHPLQNRILPKLLLETNDRFLKISLFLKLRLGRGSLFFHLCNICKERELLVLPSHA